MAFRFVCVYDFRTIARARRQSAFRSWPHVHASYYLRLVLPSDFSYVHYKAFGSAYLLFGYFQICYLFFLYNWVVRFHQTRAIGFRDQLPFSTKSINGFFRALSNSFLKKPFRHLNRCFFFPYSHYVSTIIFHFCSFPIRSCPVRRCDNVRQSPAKRPPRSCLRSL